jgi:2-polyprenyl-3-methyl-5-hydroxy-6-metoxy-1,4-benzoquinol methylase
MNLDEIAKNYHLAESIEDMFIENIVQDYEIEWVKSHVNQNENILDLGYGDGRYLSAMSNFSSMTILEGSKLLCEKAAKHAASMGSKIEIINCFFEDFNSVEKFDVVIASHVLEHVNNPKEILVKMRALLRPGGKMIVIIPNQGSLHRRLGLEMGMQKTLDELSPRDHQVGHQRVYSLELILRELVNAGYVVNLSRGFFVKSLSNSQMLHLDEKVIKGLCKLSDNIEPNLCANLGIVAENT